MLLLFYAEPLFSPGTNCCLLHSDGPRPIEWPREGGRIDRTGSACSDRSVSDRSVPSLSVTNRSEGVTDICHRRDSIAVEKAWKGSVTIFELAVEAAAVAATPCAPWDSACV
jgi:hypothetical protein